jgi:hypothetical protein
LGLRPLRPHPKISFVQSTTTPSTVTLGPTFASDHLQPVSTINMLENASPSGYDAGY